jgi:hypothetical protein
MKNTIFRRKNKGANRAPLFKIHHLAENKLKKLAVLACYIE